MQAMDRFPQCQRPLQAGKPVEPQGPRHAAGRRPVPGSGDHQPSKSWETLMAIVILLLLSGIALAQVQPGGTLPPPSPAGSPVPAGTPGKPIVSDILVLGSRHLS